MAGYVLGAVLSSILLLRPQACFTINKLSVLLWTIWSSLSLETKTQEELVMLDNECLLDTNTHNCILHWMGWRIVYLLVKSVSKCIFF